MCMILCSTLATTHSSNGGISLHKQDSNQCFPTPPKPPCTLRQYTHDIPVRLGLSLRRALAQGHVRYYDKVSDFLRHVVATLPSRYCACSLLHTTSPLIDTIQNVCVLCFPVIFYHFCIATIPPPRIHFNHAIPTLSGNHICQHHPKKWRTHRQLKLQHL